ncbi:MAG: hypothetical protein OSB62_01370 [Alphaproteobacteria bacterium]|nr:hypothetical protein [Alphaproteobacteria bacterium]
MAQTQKPQRLPSCLLSPFVKVPSAAMVAHQAAVAEEARKAEAAKQ